MANDTQTLLARRAAKLGALSQFTIPPFPKLPDSFVARFPELRQYAVDVMRWRENLNAALKSALGAPEK